MGDESLTMNSLTAKFLGEFNSGVARLEVMEGQAQLTCIPCKMPDNVNDHPASLPNRRNPVDFCLLLGQQTIFILHGLVRLRVFPYNFVSTTNTMYIRLQNVFFACSVLLHIIQKCGVSRILGKLEVQQLHKETSCCKTYLVY